jgi:hypothetical protein
VRECYDGHGEREGYAGEKHEGLAADPIREQAGEERGDDATKEHSGDDDGDLTAVEAGSGFEIRERAANDAYVNAVEKTAKSGNDQEEAVVAGESGFNE